MKLNNIKQLKPHRKLLRQKATLAEQMLWEEVRKKKICDLRFHRQFSIGSYVIDFYCPAVKLAIELDGGYHSTIDQTVYDVQRSDYLNTLDIVVMRFDNLKVFTNLHTVVLEIIDFINTHNHSSPLLKGRVGGVHAS